jgi:hypothetical protein
VDRLGAINGGGGSFRRKESQPRSIGAKLPLAEPVVHSDYHRMADTSHRWRVTRSPRDRRRAHPDADLPSAWPRRDNKNRDRPDVSG